MSAQSAIRAGVVRGLKKLRTAGITLPGDHQQHEREYTSGQGVPRTSYLPRSNSHRFLEIRHANFRPGTARAFLVTLHVSTR